MDVQATTITGVVMAGLALLGTIANNVISYFKDRDKLQYDKKVVELEGKVNNCEQKHAETNQKLLLCEENHSINDQRISKLEHKLGVK